MLSLMGSSETHSLSGTAKLRPVSVLCTEEKSDVFKPRSGNSPYSALESGVLTRVSSIGRLVTMFEPLGKNSCPTIASKTELFPEDCDPMTTIDGSVRALDWPTLERIFRISIIFLVRTIIWSSFAISSPSLSSSTICVQAPAAAAPVTTLPDLLCFGGSSPGSGPPLPVPTSSCNRSTFCIHSGSSTDSLVLSHPLPIWLAMSFAPPKISDAVSTAVAFMFLYISDAELLTSVATLAPRSSFPKVQV